MITPAAAGGLLVAAGAGDAVAGLFGDVAVGDVGLAGIVTAVIFMILGGKLVPKSALDRERANTDSWRTAAERQQEINRVQHDAGSELLVLARSTNHALTEMQAMGARAQQEKEPST